METCTQVSECWLEGAYLTSGKEEPKDCSGLEWSPRLQLAVGENETQTSYRSLSRLYSG